MRCAGDAVDEHHPARAERLERRGHLPPRRGQLRFPADRGGLRHARGTVEEHDRGRCAIAANHRQPTLRQRPADRQDRRRHGEHSKKHDQPLPQPAVAAGKSLGREQKHHRRPLDRLEPLLVDQVDDHRQRDQWQCQQQPGLQEGHRIPFPDARLTRNRASTFS